jgi:RNA polymerase sigma-70 factor (ECF subfamily)
MDPKSTAIMKLYVDRFNRRDWEGVRELISADARLTVADAFVGKLADAPYFRNYERFSMPWKLAMGDVDGEPVVIILQRGADTWTPYSIVRLSLIGQHIDRVVDYVHCPWVISMADSVKVVAQP